MLSSLFEDVLALAPFYEKDPMASHMVRRRALLRSAVVHLRESLPSLTGSSPSSVPMAVEYGGEQGYVAPVPWIRFFSPHYSPKTTAGFYIVYLFAADGSTLYLSLNQGTSEFRSNRMRPIRDQQELQSQSRYARSLIADMYSPILRAGLTSINLAVDALSVNPESKRRAHNYEAANVVAVSYSPGQIPEDDVLMSELSEFFPLLEELYLPGEGTKRPTEQARGRRGGQGHQLNVREKLAVEAYAMDCATSYFRDLQWVVEDVSKLAPFDLRCVRQKVELHVEVKGTTTRGDEVRLTPNEVAHARAYSRTALFVVSEVGIGIEADGTPVASGGKQRVFNPWAFDPSRVQATGYVYRLT